jgi:trigger factor
MNLSVERLPECKARLSAIIPADLVSRTRKEIVSSYAKQVKVPGFRPGKIPSAVVEKRFAEAIDGELRDRLARFAYKEAKETKSLNILGIAQVEREQFENDGSYLLAVEVVTDPEIEIASYKEIPVEVPALEVTDEMVSKSLENARRQRALPADKDGASVAGDLAVISYTASLDGKPLAEQLEQEAGPLANGSDHWIDLPQEGEEPREFIPGLAAAVAGMSAGETKSFDATFADDFPVEAVAGKTVTYEVTVTQVKGRELPPMDEAFAKAMGAESIEALDTMVRRQFEQQRLRMRNEIIDNQILSHLNEEMNFDLPQHIVFNETQRQVNQMVQRGYEQGMSHEQISGNEGELLRNAETQAKNNVRTMFILDEIARKEGLTVNDQEVSHRVAMIAMQQRRPIKKVVRELRDNNAFGEIRQDILISKTIEFLRAHATVTETVAPAEETPA